MIALTPETLLWAGFSFAESFLFVALLVGIAMWLKSDEHWSGWASRSGIVATLLQELANITFFPFLFLDITALWFTLTLGGFLVLGVAAIGACLTLRRAKPWYQSMFEVMVVASFFGELTTLAIYLFIRLHG